MDNSGIQYWRLKAREERKTRNGLDAFVNRAHGMYHRRRSRLTGFLKVAEAAIAKADTMNGSTDEEVRRTLAEKRRDFLKEQVPERSLVDGLAAVIQASRRTLKMDPYPVQVAAAASLFEGCLAEMATGEGKTLTVALAAALMGSTGRPCHVITSNDYLASRDAEELKEFFTFFRLRVDSVTGDLAPDLREQAYQAEITYTTPKEALADFLRDRLAMGAPHDPTRRMIRDLSGGSTGDHGFTKAVMRGLFFAVVDEADSVLIDEAVTPLIISRKLPNEELNQAVSMGRDLVRNLSAGKDYRVDAKFREVLVPPDEMDRLWQERSRLPAAWRSRERFENLIQMTLSAREFYRRGVQYIIREGKIELIDEFTGRIMAHRTWSAGLHQAVEAKEHLEITAPTESMASMSFQRFFRCFPRLSGLSGTARESREELWQIYSLPVISVPTHRPSMRKSYPVVICREAEQKWQRILDEVRQHHEKGRPVLVGTRSVQASEILAEKFREEGLRFSLLNAVRDEEEAETIAAAGQRGAITISTNMAGRGTDIKLSPGVADIGGLHVIATERHESGRIDRQLTGRAGRQGDPGSARFILSLEDDLLRRFLPPSFYVALNKAFSTDDAGWVEGVYSYAQWTAERMSFKTRKQVLKQDTWLDENLSFSGKSSAI